MPSLIASLVPECPTSSSADISVDSGRDRITESYTTHTSIHDPPIIESDFDPRTDLPERRCACNKVVSGRFKNYALLGDASLREVLEQQRELMDGIQTSVNCPTCTDNECVLFVIILVTRDLLNSIPRTTKASVLSGTVKAVSVFQLTSVADHETITSMLISLQLRPLYRIIRRLWSLVHPKKRKMHIAWLECLCERFRQVWDAYTSDIGAL